MCFQIVDDVLDLTATDETLGKPAGQDLVEGIYTLPVIYALARATRAARTCSAARSTTTRLDEARALATANGAVAAALAVARDHATKASEALAGADEPRRRRSPRGLRRLVEDLVSRDR